MQAQNQNPYKQYSRNTNQQNLTYESISKNPLLHASSASQLQMEQTQGDSGEMQMNLWPSEFPYHDIQEMGSQSTKAGHISGS
jgi:hypothetical protein